MTGFRLHYVTLEQIQHSPGTYLRVLAYIQRSIDRPQGIAQAKRFVKPDTISCSTERYEEIDEVGYFTANHLGNTSGAIGNIQRGEP